MGESLKAKRAREAKARLYDREMALKKILLEKERYLSERKLLLMAEAARRARDHSDENDHPLHPVDSQDLEAMVNEILKWRRGMLTRHEIKRYFSR